MADIQQWMRGINTSRPSTPFSTHSEALAEGDTHPRNRHSSMQGVPSKSRRPPGARISTFLHSRRPSSSFKLTDVDREVSYSTKDDVYNPDPDQMANTLLSVIMSRPGKALPPEYGSFLLHVLEAFRSVKERLSEIRMDLTEQKAGRAMDLEDFQRTADIWANEKEIYKMEIKRLELLIAEGEGGMKAFSTAREGSVRTKSNLEPDEKADDHKVGRGMTARGRRPEPIKLPERQSRVAGQIGCIRGNFEPLREINNCASPVLGSISNEGHDDSSETPDLRGVFLQRESEPYAEPTDARESDGSTKGSPFPGSSSLDAGSGRQAPNTGGVGYRDSHKGTPAPNSNTKETTFSRADGNDSAQQPKCQHVETFDVDPIEPSGIKNRTSKSAGLGGPAPKEMDHQQKRHHRRGFSFLPGDDSSSGVAASPQCGIEGQQQPASCSKSVSDQTVRSLPPSLASAEDGKYTHHDGAQSEMGGYADRRMLKLSQAESSLHPTREHSSSSTVTVKRLSGNRASDRTRHGGLQVKSGQDVSAIAAARAFSQDRCSWSQ